MPSLRPLAAPPTASPGPFLRAHLYLSPRAAQLAGPALVPPSAPAQPRQAGLDPSRAGRSARTPLAFLRTPLLGEPRRRRLAARPHRPRPRRRPQPGSACARPARLERQGGAGLRADWLRAPRGRGVPSRAEWSREPEAPRVGGKRRWTGKKGRTQVRTRSGPLRGGAPGAARRRGYCEGDVGDSGSWTGWGVIRGVGLTASACTPCICGSSVLSHRVWASLASRSSAPAIIVPTW